MHVSQLCQGSGQKIHKGDLLKDKETLIFCLQNQTFSQTLTFDKNERIDLLIILNGKFNKTLSAEHHTKSKKEQK